MTNRPFEQFWILQVFFTPTEVQIQRQRIIELERLVKIDSNIFFCKFITEGLFFC
jgi:hypothetical protein